MANAALKLFAAYLESNDYRYQILDDEETVLRVGIATKQFKMDFFFEFSDDCTEVGIKAFGFAPVTEDKFVPMYKLCNELNQTYKHACFFVEEDLNQIGVSDEDVIQLDSAAEECYELLMRLANIIDDAFPTIMKALWA